MLQLSVGGRRKTPSRKLSGLQTREGGDSEEEVAEDTQDYNGEGVLFQPHHSRHVLRGGFPRQDRGTAAAAPDTSDGSGRFRCNGTQGPFGINPTRTEDNRSVSTGLKCKQFASRQNVESSSNGSTADYDKLIVLS
jgi:hypothetical protein